MPVATETLSELTCPNIGILIMKSELSKTRREIPLPSEPTIKATGPL